eukprot:scaffold42485_cov50-Attheya_sp.AAC.3
MSVQKIVLLLCIFASVLVDIQGLAAEAPPRSAAVDCSPPKRAVAVETSRRSILFQSWGAVVVGTATAFGVSPGVAQASKTLNKESGEWEEVEEADWQTAWKDRLSKAQSMSQEEVFMAARGAGNVNLKEGPESDASKKRRAMAGCREESFRKKSNVPNVKECNSRVLQGDTSFMLDVM